MALPFTPKRGGLITPPLLPDITSIPMPTTAQQVATQRMQGAALREATVAQNVATAQEASQGYATPPGSSFEIIGGFKRGGPIGPPVPQFNFWPFLAMGAAWFWFMRRR